MQRGREPARPAFPYLRVLEALRQVVLALAPGSAAPSETELASRLKTAMDAMDPALFAEPNFARQAPEGRRGRDPRQGR